MIETPVLKAEWTKFSSVRATMVLAVAAVAMSAFLGWMFGNAGVTDYVTSTPQEQLDFSPVESGMRGGVPGPAAHRRHRGAGGLLRVRLRHHGGEHGRGRQAQPAAGRQGGHDGADRPAGERGVGRADVHGRAEHTGVERRAGRDAGRAGRDALPAHRAGRADADRAVRPGARLPAARHRRRGQHRRRLPAAARAVGRDARRRGGASSNRSGPTLRPSRRSTGRRCCRIRWRTGSS
ncbi:hypothetical protein [Nonomuraea salmonea]|uniref:hypothetical protein n=1 Tax=Nonomuraea salmonea TaxID=46181 RepID=UPI0031E6636C